MRKASAGWAAATLAVASVGLAAAVVLFPPVAILAMTLLGAATALVISWQARAAPYPSSRTPADLYVAEASGAEPDAGSAPRPGLPALFAGLELTAFLGLVVVLGAYALLITAVLVVTSPPVVKRLARYRKTRRHGVDPAPGWEAARPTPTRPAVPYSALADEVLCQLWRTSYRDLQDAGGSAQVHAAYVARSALLDEIERRNPAGFSRWVMSGARAAGDPLRYLREPGK